jgi:hypothetical protein
MRAKSCSCRVLTPHPRGVYFWQSNVVTISSRHVSCEFLHLRQANGHPIFYQIGIGEIGLFMPRNRPSLRSAMTIPDRTAGSIFPYAAVLALHPTAREPSDTPAFFASVGSVGRAASVSNRRSDLFASAILDMVTVDIRKHV